MEQIKRFDFDEFMEYYMNKSNLLRETQGVETIYYAKVGKDKYDRRTQILKYYIIANETKVYVKPFSDDRKILFSTPEEIDGKLYDFHYTFLRDTTKNKRSSRRNKDEDVPNAVIFHKTIQQPHLNNTKKDECYFIKNINLDNIAKTKCLNKLTNRMEDMFPVTGKDFPIIKEIIQRPFKTATTLSPSAATLSPAAATPSIEPIGSQEKKENTITETKANTTGGARRTRKFRGLRRKTNRRHRSCNRKSIRKFPQYIRF